MAKRIQMVDYIKDRRDVTMNTMMKFMKTKRILKGYQDNLKIFIDKVEIAVRDFLSNKEKYDIEDYDWCLDTIMVNEGAIVEQEPHTDFPRCEHDKKQML